MAAAFVLAECAGAQPQFPDLISEPETEQGRCNTVAWKATDQGHGRPEAIRLRFVSCSGVTRDVVRFFAPMRARRDVVFVDQRGTGESNRLQCDLVAGDSAARRGFGNLLPTERVRACRQALELIADLRLYTTPIAMDDLDDVRAALGYPAINLYGVSYESPAALQYLRQHPVRVRSLALSGVATPAQKLPLQFAGGAQAALDRLMAAAPPTKRAGAPFPI